MDLNKLKSIIKKEVVTANIVDQVKDDVRVFKNLQLGVMEEREKVAAPITRELGKVGKQITDLDKRQDEMLGQLRENQHAMIQYLPQFAIESPESPPALETPKRPTQPKQPITLNFDKRFDPEFLRTYDLPSANEFPNITNDKLEIINHQVTKAQKSVGGHKSAAKSVEKRNKLDEDLATLKKYKKTLDATMSTDLSEIIGNGIKGFQRKRNAYKLSKGGSFGHVYIDPANLRMNRLSVKDKAGNSLIDNVVDNSLIDLLTKRYNPKVEYTPEAKDIFKDLTRFSGFKKSKRSGKQKLLGGSTVTLVPDTPKYILARLTLLLGTRRAGNNSLDIRNEIVQLIDIAYSKKIITNEEKGRLTAKNNLN